MVKLSNAECLIKDDDIVLGTSLAPYNLDYQVETVSSWVGNGFRVVSCNTKEEIEIIAPYFRKLNIEFVEITNNAFEIAGKKLPFVKEILEIVSERTKQICGFLNSDIYITHLPDGLYEFIKEESVNSLVFTRRFEIDSISGITRMNWEIHFDGIDLFFIDKRFAKSIIDEIFFVQSAWDLSILIKAQLLGVEVKELVNPIAFHKKHSIKWNFEISEQLTNQFGARYFHASENGYFEMLERFYFILLNCKHICFCNDMSLSCLFVVSKMEEEVILNIKTQGYPNIDISICDDSNGHYDYVIYMNGGAILDSSFTRFVIYIMQEFQCSSLELGRFFVAQHQGKWTYNELNRSLQLIKSINCQCDLYINVKRNVKSQKSDLITKKLHIPLVCEKLDIEDERVFNHIQNLQGPVYIAPAGVRGCEWYRRNNHKLKGIELVGYLDNNVNKIGENLYGYNIFPVDYINNAEVGSIVVASKYYSEEIEKQLIGIIGKEKVLNANCICKINEEGLIYYFDIEGYQKKRKLTDMM